MTWALVGFFATLYAHVTVSGPLTERPPAFAVA